MRRLPADYLRSIVFGIEDSLVSTTGVIAGVSVGSRSARVTILAAIVTVAVEAISMAAGQFLSERAVHEMEARHRDNLSVGAVLMFVSYFAAGFIPVLPVFLFAFPASVYISVISALAGLFSLGYIKGRVVHTAPVRSGLEMLVIGGIATLLGVAAGRLLSLPT